MTYLKKLPNLTVKDQCSAITELVTKFFEQNGWEDQGSDYGQDQQFEKDGNIITYNKGYFGANSEPQVLGNWYNGDDINPEAEEMVNQVDTYLSEIKKSIL